MLRCCLAPAAATAPPRGPLASHGSSTTRRRSDVRSTTMITCHKSNKGSRYDRYSRRERPERFPAFPPLKGSPVNLMDPFCHLTEDADGLPMLCCLDEPGLSDDIGCRYVDWSGLGKNCRPGEDEDGMPTIVCDNE